MGNAARQERFDPARGRRRVVASATPSSRLSRGVSFALLFSLPVWAVTLYAILR